MTTWIDEDGVVHVEAGGMHILLSQSAYREFQKRGAEAARSTHHFGPPSSVADRYVVDPSILAAFDFRRDPC